MNDKIKRVLGLNHPKRTLIVLACGVFVHVAFPRYIVVTGSMKPTIEPPEYVIATRLPYWFSEPKLDDIVIFPPVEGISKVPWAHRVVGIEGQSLPDFSQDRLAQGRRDVPTDVGANRSTIPKGFLYQSGDAVNSYHGLVPTEMASARVLFHFPLPWTSSGTPSVAPL